MSADMKKLKVEIAELRDRIKRLESDVKAPLENDFSEQAAQLSDRAIRMRLLQIERENLARREEELQKIEYSL